MCHQRSALPHSACRYESRFSPKRLFIRFLHHKIACQTYTRLTISPLYCLSAVQHERTGRVDENALGCGRFVADDLDGGDGPGLDRTDHVGEFGGSVRTENKMQT